MGESPASSEPAAIVLASASPRRRELLGAAGLEFDVRPADVDEPLEEFRDPAEAALELARRKARAGAAAIRKDGHSRWVIGADTIVAAPVDGSWTLLGKPEDEREADAMLRALSSSRHQVVTGVCIVRTSDGREFAASERTWVTMRELTAAERADYVRSGEWRGKAGGYAIQESADRFVTRLEEGGFDNVVGLPVELTLRLLGEAGAPLRA